jgi:phosphoglucosamine mutase
MPRTHFGTDGVRGIVGEKITPELVERLGKAAALWSGRGRVFVGRDTRGSGPELEDALARGIVSAGGAAVLGGVLPTPAVALLALDLGAVISASHNPPEYNGVKLFDRDGHKLTDEQEEEIEALFDASTPAAARSITSRSRWIRTSSTSSNVLAPTSLA